MEHQLRSKEEAYENVNTNIKKAKQNNVIRMPKNYEAFAVIGNFVYVVKQGQFVDMTNPKNMYNQKQFNEAFQHIKFSDDKTTPNSFIRKHQVEHRVVTDMVMKPSSNKRIVTGDYGQKYLNLYAPASEPEGAYENYKRPDIMLEHMLWLCNGHDKSRLHILKWIAHLIHKPETRMTHGDGVDKCHNFMENAKQTLDSAVYGLNDAKMQVMQMLGQLLLQKTLELNRHCLFHFLVDQ